MHQNKQFLFLALALFASGAALSEAQTVSEVIAFPNAAGQDLLVNPYAPDKLFLAARTAQWDQAILQSDLAQSPPVTTVQDANLFGNYVWSRRLRSCPPTTRLPTGAIVYLGNTGPRGSSAPGWQARWSLDAGASWSNLDSNWGLAPGAGASATGFAADDSGNIYVSGYAYDKPTSPYRLYWIVRRSTDLGAHWTTFRPGKGGSDSCQALIFVAIPPDRRHGGGLFAVGVLNGSGTVMRTRDGGNTWQTVNVVSANATAVTVDVNGNIYVGGVLTTRTGKQWYLCRSTDGGNTWVSLGSPVPTSSSTNIRALAVDGSQNLWAFGELGQAWVMHRWSPSTGWDAWSYYPYGAPGTTPECAATGASTDPLTGNVFVTGYVKDATGGSSLHVLEIAP